VLGTIGWLRILVWQSVSPIYGEYYLSRLVSKRSDRPQVARLALETQNAALRIQILLAPHIAEESEKKMDELEAAMAERDEVVRADLTRLKAVRDLSGDPDLEAAESGYARYGSLRTQILSLSRKNTNVRSTALSLKDNREALRACQGALDALEQAVRAEQPTQVDYGRFGRPAELP
jgi:hypothetical protein